MHTLNFGKFWSANIYDAWIRHDMTPLSHGDEKNESRTVLFLNNSGLERLPISVECHNYLFLLYLLLLSECQEKVPSISQLSIIISTFSYI